MNKELTPEGIQKTTLKAGKPDKDVAIVSGKGELLPFPAPVSGTKFFEQNDEVIVQLINDGDRCWETRFLNDPTITKKNQPDTLKAVNK